MDFQIKKLILWPKKEQYDLKEIEFKLNQINIITGASRTGKSAIIPIIDYCLGSGSCYIPVKTIRNACSWFGILISSNGKEILLARKEPGLQKSTDDMFLLEGKTIEIPTQLVKNTTRQNVKRFLDETAKLSFLDIDSDTNNQFFGRPSFRDLMAFCFQPQNIVANANTLLYKADTTEHRTKLINIFPYILGAVTPEILAKRQQINDLVRDLNRKQRDLQKLKDVSEKWKIEINGWVSLAQEYGIINSELKIEDLSFDVQVGLLKDLINKNPSNANIDSEKIIAASHEMIDLRKEESSVAMELAKSKSRYTEMSQLFDSMDTYRNSLSIQVERLNISKWLRSLGEQNSACPICGTTNVKNSTLEKLYTNLEKLEEEAGYTKTIPAAFEREYENVKKEIGILSDHLSAVQKRIKIQSEMKNASESEKYTFDGISRFLGKVQYASETFDLLGTDSSLIAEISRLQKEVEDLRKQVDENAIEKKIDTAIRTISTNTMKLIPLLDSERPNDPIKVDYKNLTVIVSSDDGRDDYLWEIGSGSNWLAYHIAATLAFQLFFSNMAMSSVPNFIVYDQPSQVYFPQKLAAKEDDKDLDPKLGDEDRIAVEKIFKTMSSAISMANKPIQIIVLEHADESVWGKVEKVHEVCEWRGENQKLIPEEWID
jgi:Chromosome segregation ATPases